MSCRVEQYVPLCNPASLRLLPDIARAWGLDDHSLGAPWKDYSFEC